MDLYELSFDAEEDLRGIIDYTIDIFGMKKMRTYMKQLTSCMKAMAISKKYCKEIEISGDVIRILHCQKHYIFGLINNDNPMIVIAVYHERMDIMQRVRKRLK